jgi:hypothetical protein
MLKFYRNIRRRLLRENRLTRYLIYAIGEIVLVVIGILIALQINNWNEAKKNHHLEKEYLLRIREDLVKSRDRLGIDLDWHRKNAALGELVLTSLRTCELKDMDRDKVAKGLFNLGKFNSTLLVNTTLDELKTSGRLVIISNKDLVSEIINLNRRFETSENQLEQLMQWSVIPVNVVQSKIVYLNLDEDSGLDQDIFWESIEFDFDAACGDAVFASAISSLINYTYENSRRDRDLIKATEALILLVDEELKNRD